MLYRWHVLTLWIIAAVRSTIRSQSNRVPSTTAKKPEGGTLRNGFNILRIASSKILIFTSFPSFIKVVGSESVRGTIRDGTTDFSSRLSTVSKLVDNSAAETGWSLTWVCYDQWSIVKIRLRRSSVPTELVTLQPRLPWAWSQSCPCITGWIQRRMDSFQICFCSRNNVLKAIEERQIWHTCIYFLDIQKPFDVGKWDLLSLRFGNCYMHQIRESE